MPVRKAIEGEDVEVRGTFEDDSGTGVAADAAPTVDITHVDTDTVVVSGGATTSPSTGVYSYVWDTSVDTNGSGTYEAVMTGDWGAETKIVKETIELR